MATPNPMEKTYSSSLPLSISTKSFTIAGIHTTVFGLEELSLESTKVACLWLLHPRLQTQACMAPIAQSAITAWNQKLAQKRADNPQQPLLSLIAVSFDQRNHGTREFEALANQAWRSGNPKHAQDMFSIYHGTSLDTSQLITYLSSYIFPSSAHITISTNLVLGISLGGHAAWHCILHDPRITAAVITIGCPDYITLMTNRARLSKRKAWLESSPPGATFLGSEDFPPGLIEAVERYDPAGLLLGEVSERSNESYEREPSEKQKIRLMPIMKSSLQGKRILNLSGGADKLVPYKCGEPFLTWLKNAIAPGGWFEDGGLEMEDIIFDGVGHEMSPEMLREALRFIVETLDREDTTVIGSPSKL